MWNFYAGAAGAIIISGAIGFAAGLLSRLARDKSEKERWLADFKALHVTESRFVEGITTLPDGQRVAGLTFARDFAGFENVSIEIGGGKSREFRVENGKWIEVGPTQH